MQKKFFTLLLSIATCGIANAQNRMCASTHVNQQFAAQHPEIAQNTAEFFRNLSTQSEGGAKAIKYIPVVFHIIYNPSVPAGNISDAAVNAEIAQMNADYRKLNSDFSNTRPQFTGVAADAQIQFCLATTDPNGNPTTGIIRTTTTKTNWSVNTEANNMKNTTGGDGGIPPWNNKRYLNVWVVDLLDWDPNSGGTGGYAYFPSYGAQWEAIDGMVADYDVIGSYRVLTHEVGHYLALPHPWEDAQGNASCVPGDGFADTPPTDQYTLGGCPAGQTRCGGNLTQWENFMDYSNCPTMFTQEQANRMNTILSTTYNANGTPGRAELVSWGGCTPAAIALNAAFTGTPTTLAVGNSVNFTDQSTGTPTSWTWTFAGGTPATFSGQNPPAITYSTAGTYTVTLVVSDGTTSDTQTSTNYITVTSGSTGSTGCDTLFVFDGRQGYIATSVSASFALNELDNDNHTPTANYVTAGITTGWNTFYDLIPPNNDTDFYQVATSYFATAAQADNWIIFGPLTAGTQSSTLSWYHRMYDANFRDGYEVVVNTTGGTIANFTGGTVIADIADNDAATIGDTVWTAKTVNLPAQFNGQNVYIAFHHNANDMNLLLLDEFIFSKCDATVTPLNAAFAATPTTLPAGNTVTFIDQSTGNPTSWTWTFTGGTPSTYTGQNPPPITYTTAGVYTVSLTVSDGTTSDTQTSTNYITVTAVSGLNAIFTGNPTTLPAGNTVTFTNQSTGNPTTYSWSFPGGTPSSSTLQTPPAITYNTAGTYTVTLTISDGTNSDTQTSTNYITVTAPVQVNAAFTGNPTTIPVGSSVTFTNQSTGNPTTYSWSFPGGTPSSSTLQTPPPITYNSVGLYSVTLTVSNGTTSDTQTNSYYISVTQTVSTVTDTCYLRMGTDFTSIYADPVDTALFDYNIYDADGFTADTNVAPPYNGNWQILYTVDQATSDTNAFLAATSWFTPVGQANNWFTFGPITVQNDSVVISWKHRYLGRNYRDAYSIVATVGGGLPSNFAAGQTLFSVTDNDPTTANDTVWTQKQISVNTTSLLNQQVYIGFHHTGNDMLVLWIDDIIIEDCDTVTTQTVITSVKPKPTSTEVFTFMPNPSNGEVYLNYQLSAIEELTINITDALGRLIYSNKIGSADGGMLKLPLENQAAGVYFTQIQHGNKQVVKKLVIQK